jgi:hypothetical protein
MPLACTICITTVGLRGSEIDKLPTTKEELYEHMEKVHHVVVKRAGESSEQALARFLKTYPEASTCEDCKRRGAPWVV